jgi:hypothetical protein
VIGVIYAPLTFGAKVSSIDVGGQNIVVPEPFGFIDIRSIDQGLVSQLEKELLGNKEKLYAGYVKTSELLMKGKAGILTHDWLAYVHVLEGAGTVDFNRELMIKTKMQFMVDIISLPDAFIGSSNKQSHANLNPKLQVDGMALADITQDSDNTLSFITITDLSDNEYLISSNALMLINRRAVIYTMIYVASGYKYQYFDQLSKRSEKWFKDIRSANDNADVKKSSSKMTKENSTKYYNLVKKLKGKQFDVGETFVHEAHDGQKLYRFESGRIFNNGWKIKDTSGKFMKVKVTSNKEEFWSNMCGLRGGIEVVCWKVPYNQWRQLPKNKSPK